VAELRCEHVAAGYGRRTVLEDVELVVPEGSLTAILGASASGKTTLLRVIMGFSRVDQGRVVVGGTVVAEAGGLHLPPERRGVGYVAQEGALYPHLSVGENVGFGLPRAERKHSSRITEVLELVGLGRDYSSRRAHELSGGEQRRVSLARALAPRPRLVLLDEPFSALDAALRVETREAVLHALAEAGTTAVLVTHDQAEALSMGREVAVLRGGRLVQTAPPAQLYRRPVDLDVARFVGEAVVVPGEVRAAQATCVLGTLPTACTDVEGSADVMVRPEQIDLRPYTDRTTGSGEGGVTATVTGCTYFGADTVVSLTLGGHGVDIVAKRRSLEAPAVGETVELVVEGPVVVYPRPVVPPVG
jgi:iron(III) transport system ATP-binding protein